MFLFPNAIARTQEGFDKYLSALDYPFEVKEFKFSSQNSPIFMAYMYLEPQAGKPVVTLMHGKNFNGMYWEQTATMLHEQGYGVLIPDQIGFGKSSKPIEYQYSFTVLANNTRKLMKHIGIERSVIVGHSMGGMLATRFALLFPELTDRLVLVNPIGLENYLQHVSYIDIEKIYKKELKKTPEMIVNYQKKFYYDGNWSSKYQRYSEFLQSWISGPDWKLLARVNALTYDMIFTQPVIEEIDQLRVPTSLILGTRDRTAPGRANQLPGSKRDLGRYDLLGAEVKQRNNAIVVEELTELGHLPHVEDFTRFKRVFLDALK